MTPNLSFQFGKHWLWSEIGIESSFYFSDPKNKLHALSPRLGIHFKFTRVFEFGVNYVPHSPALFEWVIENLCKNAVDAMKAVGDLKINLFEENEFVIIDIQDTGSGIPQNKLKTVFNPGYTTKKRGWGLGLSLVKRIIDEYHKGKIFVYKSEIDKGTTFRIKLNK